MSNPGRKTIDLWQGDFLAPCVDRRDFLSRAALGLCALPLLGSALESDSPPEDPYVREARYVEKLAEGRVECRLCPRKCQVADKERGYCGVRENKEGVYYTLVYSRVVALNIDPIEKKPLFHFRPGKEALSLATAGCNIECKFCQNWNISQFRPEQVNASTITPKEMVGIAEQRGVPIIAYTYSEPVIFYEYMYDTAAEGKKAGIDSVMISNGYIRQQPMEDLLPQMAAVKIDLKAFTERFYQETCSGELKPVLDILQLLAKKNTWFEIVVLIVPTLNDDPSEIREMSRWIKAELGPDVPVHFTRFHPTYKIKSLPSTPVGTLERCHGIAREEGLNFVYCGNVPGHPTESTYCPKCSKAVVKRFGFSILENNIKNGLCAFCGQKIPGVWQ
jgi:pyruvate formate lyase activating enzyme